MTPPAKRLLLTASVLLLSITAGWLARQQGGEKSATASAQLAPAPAPPQAALPPSVITPEQRRAIAAAAQAGRASLQDKDAAPAKEDRYAGKEIVEQREKVETVAGLPHIKRLRLVKDPSFKYPLLRVEDELVRGPDGKERLIRQVAMVADHVLVRLATAETAPSHILALVNGETLTVRKRMPSSGTLLITTDKVDLDTVPRLMKRLNSVKNLVKYAEPDFIVHTQASIPSDPSFGALWGLHNTGQNNGIADADIDAPEAWTLSTGSRSVLVAVLDSGVDITHPDLEANIWTNPGEIPGNGIDDDGNGYVDDIHGWDFVNNDALPQDDNGHGTHCAGTIGALGNNAAGVAGVCWEISILPLKFLNSGGKGTSADAAEALHYAIGVGTSVTSNSWSGSENSQEVAEAVQAAESAGVLVVAAAGNSSSYVEYYPEYPAALTHANIISVAATTWQDGLADFSNFGIRSVDLAAPGQDIYSTRPGGTYGYDSGTSMACPHVAGACALLKAFRPALDATKIKALIMNSVDVIPALAGKTVTGGRLNLYSALLAADDLLLTPTTGFVTTGPLGGPFTPASQLYTITNYTTSTASWTAEVNKNWVTLAPDHGTLAAGESMTLTLTVNEAAGQLPAGTDVAALTFQNTTTGRYQSRTAGIQINSVPVYDFSLDTDPGWPRTGQWQFGTPLGAGGDVHGFPDPKSGATGSQVFGINLAGNYSSQPGQPEYLTAGPFDLSDYTNTRLRFERWLNADFQSWVYALVQISTDGNTWSTVWSNGTSPYSDSSWQTVEYDLSAYADGRSGLYIRWVHQVARTDNFPYSGWNLDDIKILGTAKQQLKLTAPESLTEGGSPGLARITLSPAPPTDLRVYLESNRPGEQLSLPTSVLVPAGETEATFFLTADQDLLIDGSQEVLLTATADNYPAATAKVTVHDAQTGLLTLNLPATLTEGSGVLTGQATLSLPAAAAADIRITLSSSDVTELQVPAAVTLPAGQTSVAFPLTVPDDQVIDGTQTVTVTASVTGWPLAQGFVSIVDNEPRVLAVELPPKRTENSSTLADGGRISLPGTLASPLTVALSSSDTGKLTVPAELTLAAGSSAATFPLTFVNNQEADGDRQVTVTISSPGYTTAAAVITVTDDEVPAVPAQPQPADGQNPVSPKTSLAWSYDPHSGSVPESFDVYFGAVPQPVEKLGTSSTPTWQLLQPGLTASTTYYWRIVARKGAATREGPVWSFTTPPVGPAHHFVWDAVPPAVAVGVSFPVRVTAVDEYDLTLERYDTQARLTAEIAQDDTVTGIGTYPWVYPLAAGYHDARTQSICKPEEVGPAGRLTAMALEVSTPPGQPLSAFTIRIKHTPRTDYLTSGLTWENEGWTTVYSGTSQEVSDYGWIWFEFTTPFDYDGTSNLMVDISFNNSSYSTNGTTRASITGSEYRTLAFRTDSAYGDPLEWTGSLPEALTYNGLPNLRFRRADVEVAVSPETTGSFTHGSWSGSLRVLTAANSVRLKAEAADSSEVSGLSTPLNAVEVGGFQLATEPPYTGGLANQVGGTALDTGYKYEIQRATKPDFSDAVSSGYVDEPSHQFAQLTDGKTYLYRGRARLNGALGAWSAVERSTQDATPPDIDFTLPTGSYTAGSSLDLSGQATDSVSGISSLTVNDIVGISSDSFASWNVNSLPLADGKNTFTVKVADKAVPPNVRTLTWVVTRLDSPGADTNGNGMPGLLEYAFNSSSTKPGEGTPKLTVEKHPVTQKPHLVLTYRRIINNPSHLDYQIETSNELGEWIPLAGSSLETISTTPTGDGLTESVKVRILPDLDGQKRRFARMRISTPAAD